VTQSLLAAAIIIVVWSLVAARVERWRLTAPIILVVGGVAVGFSTHGALALALNSEVAQRAAEIVLAVWLFVDAIEARGGLFGRDPRSAARLLFVALPLSVGFAVLLGLWLLPGVGWAVLLVIACVVVPIDFAPAASILRDTRVPERVRNLLNVEGGYNDGIVSPLFIFGLALAGNRSQARTPMEALGDALPQALIALAVGVGCGAILAVLSNLADNRHLMTDQSRRVIVVVAPLLTYTLSVSIHGNGFVAAFVCGIAYKYLRRTVSFRRELELVDDISFLLGLAMWFVFGSVTVLALNRGISWHLLLFCLLALTVVRVIPVLIATLGSRLAWSDRMLVSALGPRGTTSIVFGLLAFNGLAGVAADTALLTMVAAVLASVVIHGLGSPIAAGAYDRSSHLRPAPQATPEKRTKGSEPPA
jgi:NhaP-type Na+/H+ or K+/H+ antiporter